MPDKEFDPDNAGFVADDPATLDQIEPGTVEHDAAAEELSGLTEPEPTPDADEPTITGRGELVFDQPELFGPAPQGHPEPEPWAPTERPREFAPRPEIPEFAPAPPSPTTNPTAAAATASANEPAPPSGPPPTGSALNPSGETATTPTTYSPPPAVVRPPAAVKSQPPTYSPRVAPSQPAPVTPTASAVTPFGSSASGTPSADAVTVVEIAAPDAGGVREAVLAANRSESPPSPTPAKRLGWDHPAARIVTYVLIVMALTVLFLVLLINVFHLG